MVYYRLTYTSEDQSTSCVSSYQIDDFDLVAFWNSGNLCSSDISKLRLSIEIKELADYLPNPISLPIVSERLKKHIQDNSNHNISFTCINSTFDTDCSTKYYLLEFSESYRCVDLKRSSLQTQRAAPPPGGSLAFCRSRQ